MQFCTDVSRETVTLRLGKVCLDGEMMVYCRNPRRAPSAAGTERAKLYCQQHKVQNFQYAATTSIRIHNNDSNSNCVSVRNSVPDTWHIGTDPYLWLTDPDPAPDPALFARDLLDAKVFFSRFFSFYFLKVHLHHSSKIKSHKEVTKRVEIKAFLFYLLDDGRIRIRIQGPKNLRIRFRNTG